MASFSAFLEVKGNTYPLLSYTFSIHQETDSLGRPASPTLGGTITCVLSTPGSDKPFLHQWMFSPTMQEDGRLILLQDSPRATLKTISFFNAYCVGLQTNFTPGASGGGSLQTQVRISSQRVAVGAIIHDNNWPLVSHGAGETFAQQQVPVKAKSAQATEPGLLSGIAHTALDVAGMVPVIGELADGANALFYLAEGNKTDAALSAAAMIPIAGMAATGAKLVRKGVKLAGKAKALKSLKAATKAKGVVVDLSKDIAKQVGRLLKTKPNTAFFWSGRTDGIGGAERALEIAKTKGGVTLEGMIDKKGIKMPEWDISNPASIKAWEDVSAVYAKQVSGEVRAVVGKSLRPGNIWENVELPRLKTNPKVTKITTIDPVSTAESIIFKR